MNDPKNTENGGTGEDQASGQSGGTLDIKGEKTVGEILLAARERSGLSLESVSLETKIPKKSLEYLETDNFEALPSRVYVKGFLRTYAGVLGLDTQQILGRFEVQTGQTHKSRGDRWEVEETVVEEELVAPKVFRRFVLPAIMALSVIILIAWAVWKKTGGDVKPPKDEPQIETFAAAPDSGAAGLQSDVGAQDSSAVGGTGVVGMQPLSEVVAGDSGRVGMDSPAGGPAGTADRVDAGKRPAARRMEVRLVANARDTTWFDLVVYTSSGARSRSNPHDFILKPDEVHTFQEVDSILFRTIGNAGGFYIECDNVRLPVLGERRKVLRNIRLTGEGIFD